MVYQQSTLVPKPLSHPQESWEWDLAECKAYGCRNLAFVLFLVFYLLLDVSCLTKCFMVTAQNQNGLSE